MAAIFAGDVLPTWGLAPAVRWLGVGVLGVHFFVRARDGYLRRRPYWTAASWRRFLAMCCIPLAAFLFLAWLLFALDSHLRFVGEAQSPTRSAWATVSVLCVVIGGIGIAVAVEWLAHGEASRQFGLPRWLTRAR